jgi:hypothetical protein
VYRAASSREKVSQVHRSVDPTEARKPTVRRFGRSDRSAQGGGESSSIWCVDKRVTIKVNGTTTVDDHFPENPDEEIIAWKLRGDYPGMEVTFRKIPFGDLGR